MSLRIPLLCALALLISSLSISAQNPYKDFDKRSVVVKTDEDIVEAEVYEGMEDKIKKIDPEKTYYWYDHSLIMSTKGGFTGELLHGNFLVQYRNYQIKEQGTFKYGLKQGIWKSWTEAGVIKSYTTYKKGTLHGAYLYYDASGTWAERGKCKNGQKQGTIYKNAGDGKYVKVKYKNGKEVPPKERTEKPVKQKEAEIIQPKKVEKSKSANTTGAKGKTQPAATPKNKQAKPAVK